MAPPAEIDLPGISKRLRQLLGDRPVRELAERTGFHAESVRRYLNGMTPSLEFVLAVCTHFTVSADWLLLDRGNIRPADPAIALDRVPLGQLVTELQSRSRRIRQGLDAIDTLADEFAADPISTTESKA